MDSLLLDLRYALRSLRRRRTFAAVAITTIALAIGAATAIYSIVDGVLFRSLPFRDGRRIVSIWQTDSTRRANPMLSTYWDRVTLDYTDFITWRAKQTSFDAVGAWSGFGAMMPGARGPEQIIGTRVSPGLFELLGVRPILGRTFLPGEDVLGGPRLTMLSYETWMSRFGGRPIVLGQLVRFDETPYQIIGVLPQGFTLQRGKPGAPFWIPAGQQEGDVGHQNRSFHAIGRVKAGVTLEQAQVETRQLLDANTGAARHGVRIEDFVRDETRQVRAPLLILLGTVGILLLIACVNVATLLLGEAAARDVEMSARVALGATRGRIIRQLLTESLLLSACGSALGALLAWWGTRAIVALAPERIPGIQSVTVDARVLFVALAVAAITGILFGLAPALVLSHARGAPATLLRAGQTVRGHGALQRFMIATEVGLTVVLLVGAGLLSRSLRKVSEVDPGFRSDHLLAVRISMGDGMRDSLQMRAFYMEALSRLSHTPGVAQATAASNVPFTGGSSSSTFLLEGEGDAERKAHKHEVQQRVIASNYFSAMGIPLVAGRAFTDADRSESTPVAVISEASARRDFPYESALGKRVNFHGEWLTIVGVVRDTKYDRLSTADQPSIYTPFLQHSNVMDLVVRTVSDPAALSGTVRDVVQQTGPAVAITDVQVVASLVRRSFGEETFRTALIVLFGAIAAILAAVGMYGVTARAVSRRTREVGIRVALGATTRTVVGMIVNQTLAGVVVGVVLGAIAALPLARMLSPYLFGVTSYDPVTYAGIFAFLAAVSLLASWWPARRAGKVDPATILRES